VNLLTRALIPSLVAGAIFAQTPAKPALANPVIGNPAIDKPALERFIRRLKLVTPQVAVKIGDPKPSTLAGLLQVPVVLSFNQVTQEMVFYVSRDGRRIVEGNIYEIARNPFQREVDIIRTDRQPSFGAPVGAPITLVLFSDFQCPQCRVEAKSLREHLPGEFAKEVRIVFKDLPLEQIHPWSRPAAIAGRAVFRLAGPAFWDYHDWIFEHQSEITAENFQPKFTEWAKTKSLDLVQLSRVIDTHALDAEVDGQIAEARKLGISSTPTLFLNGRKLSGSVDWPTLSSIIKADLGFINK